VCQRKVLEVEGLAEADANARGLLADVSSSGPAGANCRAKSGYSKKFFFTNSALAFGKSALGALVRRMPT